MLIIASLILLLVAVIVGIAFASVLFLKMVLIVMAVVIYGGCLLVFMAVFPNDGMAAFFSAAVVGTVIFIWAFSKFGKEEEAKSDPIPTNEEAHTKLTLSIILNWSRRLKNGVSISVTKETSTDRQNNLSRNAGPTSVMISGQLRDRRNNVIATRYWTAQELSDDLEKQFEGEGRFEMTI